MTAAEGDARVSHVNRRVRSLAICVIVSTLLTAMLPAGLVAALADPTSVVIASESTSGPAGGAGPASPATVFPVAGVTGGLAAMTMVLLSAALAVAGFTRLAFRGVVRPRER